MGVTGYVTTTMSPGFGYAGIVVAMLAALHPAGVVAAAIFVATVFVGADAMSRATGVPSFIADVIVALALLTMLVALLFTELPGAAMIEALELLGSASLWAAVLRIATPLIFGVLGALLCERAGVLNLGIEGIMTMGAMVGWLSVFLGARSLDGPPDRGGLRGGHGAPARDADGAAWACRSMSRGSASRSSPRRSPITSTA
jgi:ABC-type uncharacterized transport system permease subunit